MGHILKEHWHSLSQHLQIVNSSSVMWELIISPSMLAFHLAWACLIHAVTTSVNLYVQLPSYVWKILFTCSHIPLLDLTIFTLPLLQYSLSLERRMCDTDVSVGLSILQSPILFTMTNCWSLYYLPPTANRSSSEEGCINLLLWW